MTSEFQVAGMSCAHCEAAVRGEISKIAGVDVIEVSAQSGRLVVSSSAPLDDADIIAAVDEAGYVAARI